MPLAKLRPESRVRWVEGGHDSGEDRSLRGSRESVQGTVYQLCPVRPAVLEGPVQSSEDLSPSPSTRKGSGLNYSALFLHMRPTDPQLETAPHGTHSEPVST